MNFTKRRLSLIQLTVISIYVFTSLNVFAENAFISLGKTYKENDWDTQRLSKSSKFRMIPKGNRRNQIPEFPNFTKMYIRTFISGYANALLSISPTKIAIKLGNQRIPVIMKNLKEEGLVAEATRLGKIFHIDPIHILAPIIGENTFNGSIDRTIQDKFASMFNEEDFKKMDERMSKIIDNPNVKECISADISNYWKWKCIINFSPEIYENSNYELATNFYSYSGKGTFGIGQVQPFLLWSYNDIVHQKMNNYKLFDVTDSREFMKVLFNKKEMLTYIAAMISTSINVYIQVTGVDISKNVGLTTTLYSLGDEYRRAYFYNETRKQDPSAEPQVNYLGWYVNHFESEIRRYMK